MAALDFPTSPNTNDVHTQNGFSWKWDGAKWVTIQSGGGTTTTDWIRPTDWLTIPTISPGQQKFYGLIAVYNTPGNYVAFVINQRGPITTHSLGAGGASYAVGNKGRITGGGVTGGIVYYVVDTVSSGAVTAYSVMETFSGPTISQPTPIGTGYLVANSVSTSISNGSGNGAFTVNVLTVANGGGYTVDWGDGVSENIDAGVKAEHIYDYAAVGNTVTHDGVTYRQALITVTPNGGTLVDVNLHQRHSSLIDAPTSTPWLDISMSSSVLGTLWVGSGSNGGPADSSETILPTLEKLQVQENALTTLKRTFGGAGSGYQLYKLASISFGDCPKLINMDEMCIYGQVRSFTIGNCPLLTSSQYSFYSATLLKSVTFGNCDALIATYAMFSGNQTMETFTIGTLAALTKTGWDGISVITNFLDSHSLKSASISGGGALSLTDATQMFSFAGIKAVTLGALSSMTIGTKMFRRCEAIEEIVLGNVSALTTTTQMFEFCESLRSLRMPSMGATFTIANCKFAAPELVVLFNDLASVSGKTITITNNYGADSLTGPDIKIATDKGWTVTDYNNEGKLWSWGSNNYAMLGDNTGGGGAGDHSGDKSSPVQTIAGGTNWKLATTKVSSDFSAGIKRDGTLWMWGNNYDGQLGDNSVTLRKSPVQTVAGGTDWKQASSGIQHSAGLKIDGTLWTWGRNNGGQLGDNSVTSRSSPVQTVAGGTSWTQVACGANFTMAIKTDGTLWGWGANNYGELGDNTSTKKSSPVQTVAGGTNWKQVSSGTKHTAALKTDGTLWLWGYNNYGQLGDSTVTKRSSPVQTVAGGTNWKQVAIGTSSGAIKTDGTLWLWGYNASGQLGDNSVTSRSSPVQTVAGGTIWKQIANVFLNSAAIKTDGTLWTWGYNAYGQLGDNSITKKSSPVQTVAGGTAWKQVSTGYGFFMTAIRNGA